jgi:tetratricopeptide (TPR) repeat protein
MKIKIKREVVIGLVVIAVAAGTLLGIYGFQKNRSRNNLAARISELGGKGGPPETIEGLRRAIALYEVQIEQHVRDAAQTAVYWKILATRLQDKGLHREALDALERAMDYSPLDQALPYMAGLSAAAIAKGSLDFTGNAPAAAERYYRLAEAAYLKAVSLDGRYARPLYALGVLYVFELDRPEDALPLMARYMELTTNDVDGMFVMARAYVMTEQYQAALDLYDRIISVTRDAKKKQEAEQNKQYILGVYYG